jgi:hypothetical protein
MEIFRAFIFSMAVFFGLAVIAVLVACMMKVLYMIVHRKEKKIHGGKDTETVVAGISGKED